ncbi:hypothetical protein [Burkholderia sp. LMU1-1-1.1]|uniref:hypothetical protein n=1 Tax=Burkholderia sp. LMU1-1-1.1 TaxID=3135266 RepID=UPI003436B746
MTMKTMRKISLGLSILAALGLANGCSARAKYENFTEKLTCGKANFTIKSECKKAADSMSLNECKPQTLAIEHDKSIRTATLPELNKSDLSSIIENGGDKDDLYVIKWGCGDGQSGKVALLYYSIGGGSAPYSEVWVQYDESGRIVTGKTGGLDEKSLIKTQKEMKKVRSIMPN